MQEEPTQRDRRIDSREACRHRYKGGVDKEDIKVNTH